MTKRPLSATRENSVLRMLKMVAFLCVALLIVSGTMATAQLTQIPIASVAVGLPPGTGATVCSGALNSIGDGCPGTQVQITGTQASWLDSNGNVYFVDFTYSHEVRVLYQGGSVMSSLITLNNPTVTVPKVGYVYAIAGKVTTINTLTVGKFCNGTSGAIILDIAGDGCPGYEADVYPTGGYTDAAGDVYLADRVNSSMIRIIYAGGSAAASLIKTESGGSITSPVIGSIYLIGGQNNGFSGYYGDGGLATAAALHSAETLIVDASGNVFVADTGNNAIRRIDATTGFISTIAGGGCTTGSVAPYGCTPGYVADNVPANGAEINGPFELAFDSNGNLYIAEDGKNIATGSTVATGGNRIRAIYAAGTLPGITTGLTAGNIYTIMGAGTSTGTGVAASTIKLTTPYTVSFDGNGFLYAGSNVGAQTIYRVDPTTGIAAVVFGGGVATTVGAYCSGTSGPKATDTVGDGCPSLQVVTRPTARLNFGPNGMVYIADTSSLYAIVRAFTFNQVFPETAVGTSSTLPIAVSSPASFVAPSIAASVQGTASGEFTGTAINCTAGTSYATDTVCNYTLTFTPAMPGQRVGEYVYTQSGSAVIAQGLVGEGQAPLLALTPNGAAKTLGTSIASVSSVSVDVLGNLYASDTKTGTLWKIATGATVATALVTGLSSPGQSAVDGEGNVYVADAGNNRVLEYTAAGSKVVVLSGLSGPKGVAVTGNGTLYVADTGNNRVLSVAQGVTTQLAVTGLAGPSALALDAAGNLYIADTGNQRIVGYVGGVAGAVSFGSLTVQPVGIAADAAGNLYVADKLSSSVLRLTPGAVNDVTLASALGTVSGIGLDAAGDVFYADSSVTGFDEVVQQQGSVVFAKTNQGQSSAPATITVSNIGNASIAFTSTPGYTATGSTADFSLSAGTSGCGTAAVAAGGNCTLAATFAPLSTGTYTETVGFQTNAVNTSTATGTLTGTGINLLNTTTSVTYSPQNLVYGETATFTVTITPASGTIAPTGNIVVTFGTTTKTVPVTGTATTFPLSLNPGTYTVLATYSGDANYASSYGGVSFTVGKQSTTTALTYTFSPITSTLTLTAQVTPVINGTPTGTVSFYSGGTTLIGTAPVNSSGAATYPTTTATYSSYAISAQYSGDLDYAGSTSSSLTLTGTFGVTQSSTVLTAVAGYPVSTLLTLTSYFNYSGSLTYSCSGLPVNAVCRFLPATTTLAPGGSGTLTMEVFTDVSTGAQQGGFGCGVIAMFSVLASVLMIWRKRGVRRELGGMLLPMLVLLPALLLGVTGCGGKMTISFPPTTTPAGTSTVVLTISDGAGNTQTATYMLTITQ